MKLAYSCDPRLEFRRSIVSFVPSPAVPSDTSTYHRSCSYEIEYVSNNVRAKQMWDRSDDTYHLAAPLLGQSRA